MMLNSLEWSPRDATVAWAAAEAADPRWANYTGVLITHAYLNFDGARFDFIGSGDSQLWSPYRYPTANDPAGVNDGEELWQKLIRANSQYEVVFSGHVLQDGVDRLTSANDAGQNVYQMVFNTQTEPLGGNGWLRLVEFLDDGSTARIRTISPWLQSLGQPWERTDPDNNFTIALRN